MTTAAQHLRHSARALLAAALPAVAADAAVRAAVRLTDARLQVGGDEFDLHAYPAVYAIACGKAAASMAGALDELLGARLTRGILAAPDEVALSARWQTFAGGHPLPNAASLTAGRAACALLRAADATRALVCFLISGGGSAMLELPRDERVTLAALRTTNRALVRCGAPIAEVNAVRRALSAVKGGGLAARAPHAAQVSLIVSDTNPGAAAQVASGPTYPPTKGAAAEHRRVAAILDHYALRQQLPAAVLRALTQTRSHAGAPPAAGALRRHYVLLDNEHAKAAAAAAARARGFVVAVVDDLIEAPVEVGCRALVARLLQLRRAVPRGRGVCLISGGEFVCPVLGAGVGGRNLEAALRCAVEFARHADAWDWQVAALHAGTDGVDGNSPAAGAVADGTTIARAQALGLDANAYLARSDAYNFFQPLGDTLEPGPTGTNVRDLRILLST